MNLYVLRHAIAAEPGEHGLPEDLSDGDRPLTTAGKRRLRRSIPGMQAAGVRFDRAITSPLLRAMQTAQVVMREMHVPADRLVVSRQLSPGAGHKHLVRELAALAKHHKDVMIVGHEPSLSELIGLLCAGRTSVSIRLKKGGLAKLEATRIRHGRCATLLWLLTPRQLRAVRAWRNPGE